ncbi:hypothetical protein IFM60648_10022, partial [Aspergillus lentulus]
PPAAPPGNDENRIQIRWRGHGNGPGASPYKQTTALAIVGKIQEVLRRSSLPGLASVQVAGAQVLRSGDLDVYTHSASDRERLLWNKEAWLQELPKGKHAQITNHQYTVLIHHVPITFLPSSTLSAVEHLQEKTLHYNLALRGPILHVGWCGNDAAARQSKQKSSLVISFRDAQYLNYGHAQPIYIAERVTCLYCANAHKKFCKVKGVFPSTTALSAMAYTRPTASNAQYANTNIDYPKINYKTNPNSLPACPSQPTRPQTPGRPRTPERLRHSHLRHRTTQPARSPPEDTRQLAGQPPIPVDASKTTRSPTKAPIHPIIDVSRHPSLQLQPTHSMHTCSRSTSLKRPRKATTPDPEPRPAAEEPAPPPLATWDTDFYIPVPTPPQTTGTSTPKKPANSASPPPSLLSNPARRVPGLSLSPQISNTSSLSVISRTPTLPSDLTWEVPELPGPKRKHSHSQGRQLTTSSPDPLVTPISKHRKISTKTYDTEDDNTTQASAALGLPTPYTSPNLPTKPASTQGTCSQGLPDPAAPFRHSPGL